MKRIIAFVLLFFLLISGASYKVKAKDNEPSVSADSAVLMDATTGAILYSKNMDMAYPPASTTKVMTALLTLENAKFTDTVHVGKIPAAADGSKIGLADGEDISLKSVFYGLIYMSGNDCAEALAEHVSGSIPAFVALMNKRAKELGCTDSNFVNPSGLYDENHKASAKDLALILRELAKHPEYREVASGFIYKTEATNKHPDGINLANENKLIQKNSKYYYPGAEGGKTGYTVQSQHSYVAVASRNGQRLIVALVHDSKKTFFEDSISLFNYGFNNYTLEKLYGKGDTITTYKDNDLSIPLLAGEDFFYVKDKESKDVPTYNIPTMQLKDKSFKANDLIGTAEVTFKGKSIGNLKLASGIDHQLKPLLLSSPSSKTSYVKIIAAVLSTILFLGVTLLLTRKIIRRRLRKQRRLY